METEEVDWIYLAQDKAHWPVLFARLNELLSSVGRGQFFFFGKMKIVGFRKYHIPWNYFIPDMEVFTFQYRRQFIAVTIIRKELKN